MPKPAKMETSGTLHARNAAVTVAVVTECDDGLLFRELHSFTEKNIKLPLKNTQSQLHFNNSFQSNGSIQSHICKRQSTTAMQHKR